MKRRRGKKTANKDDLNLGERVCAELREIQWQTNCSTHTLQFLLDKLRGKLGEILEECRTSGEELPRSCKYADKKMQSMVCLSLFYSHH